MNDLLVRHLMGFRFAALIIAATLAFPACQVFKPSTTPDLIADISAPAIVGVGGFYKYNVTLSNWSPSVNVGASIGKPLFVFPPADADAPWIWINNLPSGFDCPLPSCFYDISTEQAMACEHYLGGAAEGGETVNLFCVYGKHDNSTGTFSQKALKNGERVTFQITAHAGAVEGQSRTTAVETGTQSVERTIANNKDSVTITSKNP